MYQYRLARLTTVVLLSIIQPVTLTDKISNISYDHEENLPDLFWQNRERNFQSNIIYIDWQEPMPSCYWDHSCGYSKPRGGRLQYIPYNNRYKRYYDRAPATPTRCIDRVTPDGTHYQYCY